jgi:ketosteroid isomerase-like protein
VLAGVIVLLVGAGLAIAFATGAFKSSKTNTVVQTQGTGPTNTTSTAPTPTVAQVQDVLSRYTSAYSSEDSSALESLFTNDFTRSDPPQPTMDRSAAMQEYDKQFSQLTNPNYSLHNVTIKTSPGAADVNATYTVTADNTSPATGQITFHMTLANDELLIDQIKINS